VSNLEPLFGQDMVWDCPMADLELQDRESGLFHEVFECRRCGALTKDPELHFTWHGQVDTNQAVVDT